MSNYIHAFNLDENTFNPSNSVYQLNINDSSNNIIEYNDGLYLAYADSYIQEYCRDTCRQVTPHRFRRATYIDGRKGSNRYKQFIPDFDLRGQWLYINYSAEPVYDIMIFVPITYENGKELFYKKTIERSNGSKFDIEVRLVLGDYKLPNEIVDESTLDKWECEVSVNENWTLDSLSFEKIEFALHKPYRIATSNIDTFKQLSIIDIPRVPDFMIEDRLFNYFGDFGGYVKKVGRECLIDFSEEANIQFLRNITPTEYSEELDSILSEFPNLSITEKTKKLWEFVHRHLPDFESVTESPYVNSSGDLQISYYFTDFENPEVPRFKFGDLYYESNTWNIEGDMTSLYYLKTVSWLLSIGKFFNQ